MASNTPDSFPVIGREAFDRSCVQPAECQATGPDLPLASASKGPRAARALAPPGYSFTGLERLQSLSISTPEPIAPPSTSNRGKPPPSAVSPSTSMTNSACIDQKEDGETSPQPMDQLLAHLVEQQALLKKQQREMAAAEQHRPVLAKDNDTSSDGSIPLTPATDKFDLTPSRAEEATEVGSSDEPDVQELRRLKDELQAAKDKIARMDQELTQNRITKHTLDQALGPAAEFDDGHDHHVKDEVSERTISTLQRALNTSTRPPYRQPPILGMTTLDDALSDSSSAVSPGGFSQVNGIWGHQIKPPLSLTLPSVADAQSQERTAPWDQDYSRPWYQRGTHQGPTTPYLSPPRSMPASHMSLHGEGVRLVPENNSLTAQAKAVAQYPAVVQSRLGASHGQRNSVWAPGSPNAAPVDAVHGMASVASSFSGASVYQPSLACTQPRPIGTQLSPTAAEFNASQGVSTIWNSSAPSSPGQTYVSPVEPLNYRRLLDRTVNCNWKYIVDKIVCNNDQQASIFLQQKLKIGTTEQKFEIVEAIVAQAYPLMVNRFGNFLVQRCFEHGTADQVVAIANAIRGNTLNLSMDAFGCHVVQKAFDCVPEEYKAIMVRELLRRIPETVIHRYACHVWQKLFELRWNDSPPQIMKYVNESLRGMWHEVALGETGSLVVQNIFENCLEEDKRPCISEVLASIDIVAHGQFGNWCIQHICEHGAPMDRGRAVDHVLRFATEYSMDQFASKVVEKCLKIGGSDFLERYLNRVCEAQADRPRIPLIDIASDQYGNYLVQYILTHSNAQHRETVASHIRKHMVSLRGSKFGSRVGMLCCNPAFSTRPGPGSGPSVGRYGTSRFGGAYR